MQINNPEAFDHIILGSGEVYRVIKLDIGAWNMVTTPNKIITHGVSNWESIIVLGGRIQNDANDYGYNIFQYSNNPANAQQHCGVSYISNTAIQLTRGTGAFFDRVEFDDPAINRGWIIIAYEE